MKIGRKLILCLTIFALLWGAVSPAKMASAKAKKYGYLGGENGYQDLKIKYKGHKLYLRGYAWKTKGERLPKYPSRKKKKIKKTVKIGNDCKINVGTEPEKNFKFKSKKKVKRWCGKGNTWFSAPELYVIIKGNKAVYISLGA